ncbi:MAG: glucosyl-3-phosphoglycerate synthase [Actinomycetota bacterium]|nr:glucosyl-3-phosphoglycerate synthase [Actinomycetota bacterium]
MAVPVASVKVRGDGETEIPSWGHRDMDLGRLAEAKIGGDHHVSVCLPARDEAETIGAIVTSIREGLVDRWQLVDEVLVVDDGSSDRTAVVAADAGARVVVAADVLPHFGSAHGKGEALWKSLHAAKGDLLVFCDADVRGFSDRFVVGLLGPLLLDPAVGFVKGYYRRPVDGADGGGGRVTELVARPLISLLFPHLRSIVQPLAGEFAARRSVLEQVPFVGGYGVDLGLLIDVASKFGLDSLAQADLGSRVHRNRPLDQLAPQALAVLHGALRRAGVDLPAGGSVALALPGDVLDVQLSERPAMIDVAAYRQAR